MIVFSYIGDVTNRIMLGCSVLVTMLICSHSLAQKRSIPKKARPMLTISHPVSKIRVILDQPAFVANDIHDSAWRRVIIYLPDKTTRIIKIKSDMSGYMLESDERKLWSPDGRYLAVWLTYGILNKDQFSGMRIVFIDLKKGEETDTIVEDGFSITSYDFKVWPLK